MSDFQATNNTYYIPQPLFAFGELVQTVVNTANHVMTIVGRVDGRSWEEDEPQNGRWAYVIEVDYTLSSVSENYAGTHDYVEEQELTPHVIPSSQLAVA
ncbi:MULTISPECIES: hypothetical protein [unclassified Anabaena]|uniref:hypothetical protein n=1 Tax=unclassified Anabaena TaxID=2619674 RepID=UPI0008310177|nr:MULTISPECIES: hypothetical protein [unclassified Anabaena]